MSNNCVSLLSEICRALHNEWITEAQQLKTLLINDHLIAILSACDEINYAREQQLIGDDKIVNYDYCESQFSSDVLDTEFDGEEENQLKFVTIIKGNEPLGATITFDDATGLILVTRIMHGGAAHRSGLVAIGDAICEVNGIWLHNRGKTEIVHYLEKECRRSMISFKLISGGNRNYTESDNMIIVKAHFDYNPVCDPDHPCSEAGLVFKKGDILQIVEQEDEQWWQARHYGDEMARAALVPSSVNYGRRIMKNFDYKTQIIKSLTLDEIVNRAEDDQETNYKWKKKGKLGKKILMKIAAGKRNGKSSKDDRKLGYFVSKEMQLEALCSYEQVALMEPSQGLNRPLVIIGAKRVGKTKIIQKLLQINYSLFRQPMAHTSREPIGDEVLDCESANYYFVSKEWMKREIGFNHFIEYKEFNGNYYGIHENTIIELISSGLIALITIQPQSLKHIRKCRYLRPFVILIKPADTLMNRGEKVMKNKRNSKQIADDEISESNLVKLIVESHKIEYLFSHYCDLVLINDNVDKTANIIMEEIKRLQNEPQWVPTDWLITDEE